MKVFSVVNFLLFIILPCSLGNLDAEDQDDTHSYHIRRKLKPSSSSISSKSDKSAKSSKQAKSSKPATSPVFDMTPPTPTSSPTATENDGDTGGIENEEDEEDTGGLEDVTAILPYQVVACDATSVEIVLNEGATVPQPGELFLNFEIGNDLECLSDCSPIIRIVQMAEAVGGTSNGWILETRFATFEEAVGPGIFEDTSPLLQEFMEPKFECPHSTGRRAKRERTGRRSLQELLPPVTCEDYWPTATREEGICFFTGCVNVLSPKDDCFNCGNCDNGCGPEGGILRFDGNLGFADFGNACCNHDYCWSTPSSPIGLSRQICDLRFLVDMLYECQQAFISFQITCEAIAYAFYLAVSESTGDDAFRNAKTKQNLYESLDCDREAFEAALSPSASSAPSTEISADPTPEPTIEECTQTTPPRRPGSWSGIFGDPHLSTFDRYRFDCQAGGEFITLTSIETPSFMIQERFTSVASDACSQASVSTGVVVQDVSLPRVQVSTPRGNADIGVSLNEMNGCPVDFYVDGTAMMLSSDLGALAVVVCTGTSSIDIQYPATGIQVAIRIQSSESFGCFFTVRVFVPNDYRPSETLLGLLGTPNGNGSDDWRDRNGNIIQSPQVEDVSLFPQSYQYCVENWCTENESESIFTYSQTESFSSIRNCDEDYADDIEAAVANPSPDLVTICGSDIFCLVDGACGNLDDAVLALQEEELIVTAQEEANPEPSTTPSESVAPSHLPTLVPSFVEDDSGLVEPSMVPFTTFPPSSDAPFTAFPSTDFPSLDPGAFITRSIFPTGQDQSGRLLPPGEPDNHWIVLESFERAVVQPDRDGWLPNGPFSSWIWQQLETFGTTGITRSYQTRFPMDGLVVASATLRFEVMFVGELQDVILNSVSMGITAQQSTSPQSFEITEGLVSGENSITFVIFDSGPWAALRVFQIGVSAQIEARQGLGGN